MILNLKQILNLTTHLSQIYRQQLISNVYNKQSKLKKLELDKLKLRIHSYGGRGNLGHNICMI